MILDFHYTNILNKRNPNNYTAITTIDWHSCFYGVQKSPMLSNQLFSGVVSVSFSLICCPPVAVIATHWDGS